ncbi:MAG: hypothetical protein JNK31_07300 [Candidatus Competibacter sp.]|nr:hypothetical protein [Candidatus Competibacter sp.]
MLYRGYLSVGILILLLFAAAQYRGWSVFAVSEAKSPPGTARGVYHK